jgi:DNA-binding HxlR family transcriptional regulator
MCQDDIIELLRSNPSRWWSSNSIHKNCKDIRMATINRNLKKLGDYNIVWRKEGYRDRYKIYLYKYKYYTNIF